MSQHKAAGQEGISLESANKIWQEFANAATRNGLDTVLESRGLLDAVGLANTVRQMRKLDLTPVDCNRAVPLAGICRNLNLNPELIRDFIESAVRLAQPGFPVAEYVNTVARIHRRERVTGLTVDQVDSTHETLTTQIQSLRTKHRTIQTRVQRLRATNGTNPGYT